MENNLKNKTIFFAQHWGQKIVQWEIMAKIQILGSSSLNDIMETDYLELKPLSSITDDDLGNIARFYKPNAINVYIHDDQLTFDYYHGDEIHSAAVELNSGYCLDYLRSNSYATEWMGLSVKQLEEYGWIKLKK